MKSGGLLKLRRAVKESGIAALSSAMRFDRMAIDIIKFGLKSRAKDAQLMQMSMSGSAQWIAQRATDNVAQVKIGSVEDSLIFQGDDILPIRESMPTTRFVMYGGKGFYGHPSADNVINHALMVNDGLNASR